MSMEGIIVLSFCVLMIGVGYLSSKRAAKSTEDFYLGGRKNSALMIAAGNVMGWVGAGTLIGAYGKSYFTGLSNGIWYIIGFGCSFILFAVVFAGPSKRLGDARGTGTFVEIWRHRFGTKFGAVWSVFQTIQDCAYCAGQIIAIAIILDMFVGVPYNVGCIGAALIIYIYVSLGGMEGSLRNTLIQMFITFIGIIIAVVVGFKSGGGLTNMLTTQLPAGWQPGIFEGQTFGGIVKLWLPVVLVAVTYNAEYMRTFAAKNRKHAIGGGWLSAFITVFVVLFTACGIIVCVTQAPGLESGDYALIYMLKKLLPWGAPFFVAAILSACMSTCSEAFLGNSAIFSKDVYKPLFKPNATDKQILKVGRIYMIFFAIMGCVIAQMAGSILSLMYFACEMLSVCVPVFIAGFWWNRTTSKGAISGVLVGCLSFFAWSFIPGLAGIIAPLYVGLILSAITVVAVSLVTPPPTKEQLDYIRPFQREDWEKFEGTASEEVVSKEG